MPGTRVSRAVGIAAALLCVPAASSSSGFTFGPSGGTTGVGFEAAVELGQHAGLRFSHGLMGGRTALTLHGLPYQFDASLEWLGAFVDLYPSSGPFRLSAGAMAVYGDVGVAISPGEPVTVAGCTYSPEQLGSVSGELRMEPVVPYLGLGWDSRRTGAIGFSLDLGAAFQEYDLEMSQQGGTLPLALQQALGTGVEAERQNLEDRLNSIGIYPVARLGVSLNF